MVAARVPTQVPRHRSPDKTLCFSFWLWFFRVRRWARHAMTMRGSAVSLARVQVRRARQAYHRLPPAARGVRLVPHRGRTVVPFGRAAAVVDPAQQPRVSSVDADEKTSTSGTVSDNGPVSGRDRARMRPTFLTFESHIHMCVV